MASDRQIAANRANARKSTGPRTAEGKAASSANALKTGIYAKSTLLPGEDPAEYDALRAEHYDQFAPANPDERDLLDLMIKYKWQLRRLHDCYDQMWIQYDESDKPTDNPPLAATFIRANLYNPNLINVSRMIHSTDRAFHRTRAALLKAQEKRQKAEAKSVATPAPHAKLASFPEKTPSPLPDIPAEPHPVVIGFVPSKPASPHSPAPPSDISPLTSPRFSTN